MPVARVPEESDLRVLPLRALVAFACRCAARVQPVPSREFADYSRAIAAAITVADAFARGDAVAGEDAERIADEAVARTEAFSERPDDLYSAGYAAGYAAKAASTAIFTLAPPVDTDLGAFSGMAGRMLSISAREATCGHVAAAAAAADGAAYARVVRSRIGSDDPRGQVACERLAERMWADIKALGALNLGAFPEEGRAVDPSPTGPLGAY